MIEIWPETFIPNHTWQKATAQPAAFSSTGVSCPGHCAFPHPQLEAAAQPCSFSSTGVSCPGHCASPSSAGGSRQSLGGKLAEKGHQAALEQFGHIMVSVFCLKVYEGYGQTECTAGCTFTTPGDWTSGRTACTSRAGGKWNNSPRSTPNKNSQSIKSAQMLRAGKQKKQRK